MREIKKIILHCSDSIVGEAELINIWHQERGWKMIGYHFVILNGCRTPIYQKEDDGRIEEGRRIQDIGAHCEGHNNDSIGICLIGKHHFSAQQLYVALPALLRDLLYKYSVPVSDVFGHYEFNAAKTCPNMDMKMVRERLMNLL